MLVENIKDTSGDSCKCGSWLDHWEKTGGQPSSCSVEGCSSDPEVGAHIRKHNSSDTTTYIVPFCSEHNQQEDGSLDVGDTLLVPAVDSTCS